MYDNIEREYVIYIPSSYDGLTSVPLIFSFHGGGGNIQENILINDLSELAESENFIAVYPQALPDPNDDGGNLWIHKEPTDVDDVFFIEALIDSIVEEPLGGAHRNYSLAFDNLKIAITNSLNSLKMLNTEELVSKRQEKIRGFGKFKEAS